MGHCLLLILTLCQAVRDKPVLILTSLQASAFLADGILTHKTVGAGQYESDPLTRPCVGSPATWKRMAPCGAAVVVGEMWLAEKMRRSKHGWMRKVWWLPQVATIGASAYGIHRNVRILRGAP